MNPMNAHYPMPGVVEQTHRGTQLGFVVPLLSNYILGHTRRYGREHDCGLTVLRKSDPEKDIFCTSIARGLDYRRYGD